MTVVDILSVVIGLMVMCLLGFGVYGWGRQDEQQRHRPFCDCPECTKWRAEMKALGEKQSGQGEEVKR